MSLAIQVCLLSLMFRCGLAVWKGFGKQCETGFTDRNPQNKFISRRSGKPEAVLDNSGGM